MKRVLCLRLVVALALLVFGVGGVAGQQGREASDPAAEAFWVKFQAAVKRGDKEAVVALTKLPLAMPYGEPRIRTRAQFLKSYRKIFDAETTRCFAAAKPQIERGKVKGFTISCGEAMLYWFQKVNGRYMFTSVDNVNE